MRINGHDIIAPDETPAGYVRLSAALVNAACNYFFQRRRMSTGCDFTTYPSRFPCGKKRPEGPHFVRIRRTDLSRAKRNSSLVTCHSSLSK